MKKHTPHPSVSDRSASAAAGLSTGLNGDWGFTRYDWIVPPVIFLAGGIWLFFNIYSAINWDDLLYMSLARCTWGEAWVLNRYGHIYLLKLFSVVFFDTILGCRIYWCFLFAATGTLTYYCARLLAGRKTVLVGIIAVLFVYMEPMFGREAGSPLADFTVMFLVILGVFIYLFFLGQRDRHTHWLLMALGLIFFWAVKSKEIGICLGVLFLGFGRDNQNRWHIGRHLKDIGWLLCGAAGGCLILMCLDAAFIGDFWFSVRPSNIKQLFGSNLGTPFFEPQDWTAESWFAFFTTRPFFVLFILYVIAGFTAPAKNLSIREKLVWAVPLFLMLFLTFSRRGWYVVPRYFSPAMPIMAIFGAQFFNFGAAETPAVYKAARDYSKRFLGIGLMAAAFVIIAFILVPKIDAIVEYYKLDGSKILSFPHLRYDRLSNPQLLYMLAIMPLAMSGLLVTAVLTKNKRGLPNLFFTSLFLFALILPPLRESAGLIDTAYKKSKWRYEPCRIFEDEFTFGPDTKILVSKTLFQSSWLLGRDASAHCHMFNIYFNGCLKYEQFIDGGEEDILKADYDYALLSVQDIINLRQKETFTSIMQKYSLVEGQAVHPWSGGQLQIFLLKKI